MSESHNSSLEHFRTFGWVRVPGAFSSGGAAAMCDVIWAGLAKVGILRNDRSTWTKGRPEHLQHLKQDPSFRAIGSARTVGAINAALEGRTWEMPSDWGASFPRARRGGRWNTAAGHREHGIGRRRDTDAYPSPARRSARRASGQSASIRAEQGVPGALLVSAE
jgi:hypothetical protein